MKTGSFLLKSLLVLFCGIIICTVLIVAVYAIPTSLIADNVAVSADLIEEQGMMTYVIPGYAPSNLDQFTDSVMLGTTVYKPYDSLLENAMMNSCFVGESPIGDLKLFLNGQPSHHDNYGRYWHGYLTYLKPLLIFFSIGSIRLILGTIELLLLVLITSKLSHFRAIIPFFCFLATLCLPAMLSCVQYASCPLVGFTAAALLIYDVGNKENSWLLFLITGMATAFFDFLTYPVLTLILPASIWLLKHREDFTIRTFIMIIISWWIGYVGLWGGKWLVGSLLTDHNFFAEALGSILVRTSATNDSGDAVSLFTGLLHCLKMLLTTVNVVAIGCGTLWCLAASWKSRSIRAHFQVRLALLFLITIPIAWAIVTCNHSYSHRVFAYRTLASAVFPLLLAISPLSSDTRDLI